MQASTAVSVVVASHGRHLRLLWLLNALEEQTLDADLWRVVVVHDYDDSTAHRAIRQHPLRESGRLREIAIAPGTGSPARQRNLGWRSCEEAQIAFTDDDCRPEPDWLEGLLRVAARVPGAVVQGATRPDPFESAVLAAPHVRTMSIDPVGPYVQTCNILYPRDVLVELNGFDERAMTGEDVDLGLRARERKVPIVAAPGAVVNHAVEAHSLPGIIRQNLKWRHLALVVKEHPELRRELPLRVFWDADHLRTTLALAGLSLGARRRWFRALCLPYLINSAGRRGSSWRGRAVALAEVPGQVLRQAAEVLGLALGSLRHGTILL